MGKGRCNMPGDGLSALILAGGRSRRMGQDKLWMTFGGTPLVERVVERILPLAGELLFSTNAPARFEALVDALCGRGVSAQVVADLYPGAGPLAGLHAGLKVARHDLMLALAADMPFVNAALIEHMIGLAPGFDAVVPEVPNRRTGEVFREPLHALYRRSCLPAIGARLAAGDRRMTSFLPDVCARFVPPDEIRRFDPDFRSFFNANTPEEWEEAQRLLATESTRVSPDRS